MMFLCKWTDADEAFLVDAKDEREARSIATTEGDSPPDSVQSLPVAFFAAWVRLGNEDDDPEDLVDTLVIQPLEHVDELLTQLAGLTDEPTECGASGELDDGEVVTCTEPEGHAPPHKAKAGGVVTAQWDDAE